MNIQSFLSDPNRQYKTGIELYNLVKTSKEYDNFFANAGSPNVGDLAFNILDKQLARALRKQNDKQMDLPITAIETQDVGKPIAVNKIQHQQYKSTPNTGATNQLIDIPGLVDVNTLPEEIKAAYLENKKLMVEISGARQRMAACTQASERQPIAREIAALHQRKEANWQMINKYVKHGQHESETNQQPEESYDPVSEALKTNRRIETVKINISRAQKEINSGNLKGKKLETRLNSLQKWETELAELENRLPS